MLSFFLPHHHRAYVGSLQGQKMTARNDGMAPSSTAPGRGEPERGRRRTFEHGFDPAVRGGATAWTTAVLSACAAIGCPDRAVPYKREWGALLLGRQGEEQQGPRLRPPPLQDRCSSALALSSAPITSPGRLHVRRFTCTRAVLLSNLTPFSFIQRIPIGTGNGSAE